MSDPALSAFIARTREDLADTFRPRAERALARWPVVTRDVTIAGVPTMVVEPKTGPSRGTLLYLFGGGYVSGAPEFDLPITAAISALGGFRILAPSYPLAPEHRCPEALDQMQRVYETLVSDGPLVGIIGESAGGGMALALALRVQGQHHVPPLALLSPWVDLTPAGLDATCVQNDPTLSAEDLRLYARAYVPPDMSPEMRDISPGVGPLPAGLPPVYLSTGSNDILRPGVLALQDALLRVGADVTMFDAPGMVHVFEVYDEEPHAETSLRRVVAHFDASSRA